MSKVNVKYNRIEEINIITAETMNELLKKRDKLLFVPFSFYVHHSFKCTKFIN